MVTTCRDYFPTPLPEKVESIDELIKIGKREVHYKVRYSSIDDSAAKEPHRYLEKALVLMGEQGIQNGNLEFDIRYHIGLYLEHTDRSDQARPHLERCISLKPEDTLSRELLGKVYHNMGEHGKSLEQFNIAICLLPLTSIARNINVFYAIREYLETTRIGSSIRGLF